MNILQRYLMGFMALVMAGFVVYPEWRVTWNVRLDYVYYYDKDLDGSRPPAGLFEAGSEIARHGEVRRAFLVPGPRVPQPLIPPPKAEATGTGTLDLGLRHTIYTNAAIEGLDARINGGKLAADLLLLLIPMAMFAVMFRDRPRKPSIKVGPA